MVKACVRSCVYVRMDQSPARSRTIVQFEPKHVRLWGQTTWTTTTLCSCVEPGPAWLSCNVPELCDQTDESLKVSTVFKVSQNLSTNSVLNFFWSFFFPITFSFCVAHWWCDLFSFICSFTCHEIHLFPLNYSSFYSFFSCRSIVVIGLALPTEYLQLTGLFSSFIVLWIPSEEWMSLEAVAAKRPPWPPGYLSVAKVKTMRIPFLNFNAEVPPEQSPWPHALNPTQLWADTPAWAASRCEGVKLSKRQISY